MRPMILALALLGVLPASARPSPECKAALAAAERVVKGGDRAAADVALDEAIRLGADPPEGGECVARAMQRKGDVALRARDHAAAARHYRQAAHRTVEHHPLWRAATAARIPVEKRLGHARTVERLAELLALDGKVVALDRRPAVGKSGREGAARTLDAAAAAFRADKDPVRAAWATAVKAKVLASSGDGAAARAIAAPLAEGARLSKAVVAPRFVRVAAEEALMAAALEAGDPEAEARASLRADALRAELAGRSAEQRRFARSPATDRACARYEKAAGEGRCAALAHASTGEFSFSDPSRARPRRSVSEDEIDRAQRQYTPAIEGCVREAVKAHGDGELFENASLKIGWAVRSDGRAGDVEIEPRRYDVALGGCVRERVGWFRYPRATDGRSHSVVLPFHLEVTEKFGGRH